MSKNGDFRTGPAAGASLLSPAREAGGAEDRLWNSGHRDRFGRLRWSRCQCRRRSGGGLLLQRLSEWAGGQRCAGVRRQTTAPAGAERAGGAATAGGTGLAQLAAGVEEGFRQDDQAACDIRVRRGDGDGAGNALGREAWITLSGRADELTGPDGDVAARPAWALASMRLSSSTIKGGSMTMLPPLPVPPATDVVTVLLCRSNSRPTASVTLPPSADTVRVRMAALSSRSVSAAVIEMVPPGPVPSLCVVTVPRSLNRMFAPGC